MRAPKNNPKGTAGQSHVKGEFEELGWGAVLNSDHDVGTDLWLMARDSRRFDLQALVGAQVKSGPSFFKKEVVDEHGKLEGWWYAESDNRHFDYWRNHSVPHILVLHDLVSKRSYWVAIDSENIKSTGKGSKIFVSAKLLVNTDHFAGLVDVAMNTGSSSDWEGSVWEVAQQIPTSARLRYALLAPRLIAPHPNKGYETLSAYETIALCVQMRISDVEEGPFEDGIEDLNAAAESKVWEWRFAAALYTWLMERDITVLVETIRTAENSDQRVAAICCFAFAQIELGAMSEAIPALEAEISDDEASPVDHAWLQISLAQCKLEIGCLTEARRLSIEVQALRRSSANDPTAMAFVAASGAVLFDASDWDGESLANLVQSSDTATSWWRSQTIAAGLNRHFVETFSQWAGGAPTWYTQDEAFTGLRSAMVLSGLAGDLNAWRYSASLLARRLLMIADENSSEPALNLLRVSGDQTSLKSAASKLLEVGPLDPLIELGRNLDLSRSTRVSILADLQYIQKVADVLDVHDCDRFARWALEVLREPEVLRQRLCRHFVLEYAVLEMLARLLRPANSSVRQEVIEHLIDVPLIGQGLAAKGYASVLAHMPHEEWTEAQIEALSDFDGIEDADLRGSIDSLLASKNTDFRSTLLQRISDGDLQAFSSYGELTDLPSEVVTKAMPRLVSAVEEQICDAKKGSGKFGKHDCLDVLVLMNLLYPSTSNWSVVSEAFELPNSYRDHLQSAIQRLGFSADRVPSEIRLQMKPHLESIATRDFLDVCKSPMQRTDIRGDAELTLALLFPDDVRNETIRRLVCGEPSQRVSALKILSAQCDGKHLTLLLMLSKDSDMSVRAAAAECLSCWVLNGTELLKSQEALKQLLAKGGTLLGRRISRPLADSKVEFKSMIPIVTLLRNHPSALVRLRLRHAEKRAALD